MVNKDKLPRHPHGLVFEGSAQADYQCDICKADNARGTPRTRCEECDYDECVGCFRMTRSFYKGHCSHCKGLAAVCGCKSGCPKPPSAECISLSQAASAPHINLFVAVSAGGEVSSLRRAEVLRAVKAAKEELSSRDIITLVRFHADEASCYGPSQAGEFDFFDDFNSGTFASRHLYDSIDHALHEAFKQQCLLRTIPGQSYTTCVLFITDGVDGGSKTKTVDVLALLENLNTQCDFKVVFAGEHLPPAGRAAMERLGRVGDGDIRFVEVQEGCFRGVFERSGSMADLAHVFAHMHAHLGM